MGKRNSPRIEQTHEARIFGLDDSGKPFSIKAETVDVSVTGVRLRGVDQFQFPGQTIGLESEGKKSRFLVKWVGRKGSANEGHIGLKNVDPANQIWDMPQVRQLRDNFSPPKAHDLLRDNQVLKWFEWRNDRRLFRRLPTRAGAKVVYPGIKNEGWGICSDISTTGCFIETMWPLAVDTRLDVVLRLNGREVRARAVVRSAKPQWGMGLEFIKISDEDKAFLKALVEGPRAAGPPKR
jgi:hypothetical protein